MTWHAVDASGRDLATGRPPVGGTGWSTPAASLAAAPMATWPMAAQGDDGRRLGLGPALGPGGDGVETLLGALSAPSAPADGKGVDVEVLARATPAGVVSLPFALVGLGAGVKAAGVVDPAWLARMERRRSAPRRLLTVAGRELDMEAALHVVVLMATEHLDPADDADVEAHVASGAQLWLLAGAVVSALAGAEPDPFAAWARLVAAGLWPVGPGGGELVVSATHR